MPNQKETISFCASANYFFVSINGLNQISKQKIALLENSIEKAKVDLSFFFL